jgi:TatD DNase family protein
VSSQQSTNASPARTNHQLIETHAHLDYPDFANDFGDVLQRATDAGVTRIITIGTSVESSRRAVELSEKYPNVFAVIGIHPTYANEAEDDVITPLRELAKNSRVVAIGEIGLDYHYLPSLEAAKQKHIQVFNALQSDTEEQVEARIEDGAYKSKQAELFQQLLDLAVELRLNVVIHQRDAWDDTLEILRDYGRQVSGVFHCFGGTLDQANEVIDLGHLVSFTGIVTFRNGKQVREVAARVPLDKFMVETDCPYLAPVPFRGKRCEPAYTRLVAEEIAKARGLSLEEIAGATSATAEEFFRFERG